MNDDAINAYVSGFGDTVETVAHEFGHALGLGHEFGTVAQHWDLMYPYNDPYAYNNEVGPTRDDMNGIISIYGGKANHQFSASATSSASMTRPGGGVSAYLS
ncbi:MAG: matrixin family metalloprotease [Nitrososphaerales archaeon]